MIKMEIADTDLEKIITLQIQELFLN